MSLITTYQFRYATLSELEFHKKGLSLFNKAAILIVLAGLIRSFKTTAGIFGVTGNYDHPLSNPAISKAFKAAGIDILINENRAVALPNGKILHLAGFHDSWNKRAKLNAFSGIPPGARVFCWRMIRTVSLMQ